MVHGRLSSIPHRETLESGQYNAGVALLLLGCRIGVQTTGTRSCHELAGRRCMNLLANGICLGRALQLLGGVKPNLSPG